MIYKIYFGMSINFCTCTLYIYIFSIAYLCFSLEFFCGLNLVIIMKFGTDIFGSAAEVRSVFFNYRTATDYDGG